MIGRYVKRQLYLSVPPTACTGVIDILGWTGLSDGARIILEKPFG